jgi:methyl-accepting chemotaxis protein
MDGLAELSARIHAATLEQVKNTAEAFHLVELIAKKAQQIVERTTQQYEQNQKGFENIQTLETISTRNVAKLHEAQQRAQELVVSVEKLRHLVRRFTV